MASVAETALVGVRPLFTPMATAPLMHRSLVCRAWRSRGQQRVATARRLRCLPKQHMLCRCLHNSQSLSSLHATRPASTLPSDAASSHLSTPSSSSAPAPSPPAASSSLLERRPVPVSQLSAAEQAERDQSVAVHLHRQQLLQAALHNTGGRHLRIAFDLSFSRLAPASASSLATQLSFVMACNRQAAHPACIFLASLDPRLSSGRQEEAADEAREGRAAGAADGAEQLTEGGRLEAERPFVFQMLKRGATSWQANCSSLPVDAIFSPEEVRRSHRDGRRLEPAAPQQQAGLTERCARVRACSVCTCLQTLLSRCGDCRLPPCWSSGASSTGLRSGSGSVDCRLPRLAAASAHPSPPSLLSCRW